MSRVMGRSRSKKNSNNMNNGKFIQQFVMEYVRSQCLTRHQVTEREKLIQRLQQLLSRAHPGAVFHKYGSYATGLHVRSSDIDLGFTLPNDLHFNQADIPTRKKIIQKILGRMEEELRRSGLHTTSYLKAFVPIVKCTDQITGVDCDVCHLHPDALVNANLVRLYAQYDERVAPLLLVIKQWSKQRSINDASRGTLNSFGWTCLVICYLQRCSVLPVIPGKHSDLKQQHHRQSVSSARMKSLISMWEDKIPEKDRTGRAAIDKDVSGSFTSHHRNIGNLLVGFFETYTDVFNVDSQCVCVQSGQFREKSDVGVIFAPPYPLVIRDPANSSNNVARSVTRESWKNIRKEMLRSLSLMQNSPSSGWFEKWMKPAKELNIKEWTERIKGTGSVGSQTSTNSITPGRGSFSNSVTNPQPGILRSMESNVKRLNLDMEARHHLPLYQNRLYQIQAFSQVVRESSSNSASSRGVLGQHQQYHVPGPNSPVLSPLGISHCPSPQSSHQLSTPQSPSRATPLLLPSTDLHACKLLPRKSRSDSSHIPFLEEDPLVQNQTMSHGLHPSRKHQYSKYIKGRKKTWEEINKMPYAR